MTNCSSPTAGLELETGKLIYYLQGWYNGDCKVVAHGDYAFVGKDGVVNLFDFREVGSKWMKTGIEGPPEFVGRKYSNNLREGLFETPYVPYKDPLSCNADSVFYKNLTYNS